MNYKKPCEQRSVIAVDLDGIICQEARLRDYANSQPIKQNIDKVNKLYDLGYTVIIHTARLELDRIVTTYWLKKHNLKYTALVMEKLRADYYIDDKNQTL